MDLIALHNAVVADLANIFSDWRYIKSQRSFVQKKSDCKWYLHLSYINHEDDFDVVADIAVEHVRGGQRIFILGAELGNILGTGQHRWPVSNLLQAANAAKGVHELFVAVGLPMLKRFSKIEEVLHVLRTDPQTSRLISPLTKNPVEEAAEIEVRLSSLTNGSSRSLRSLGRAKARPLTKR